MPMQFVRTTPGSPGPKACEVPRGKYPLIKLPSTSPTGRKSCLNIESPLLPFPKKAKGDSRLGGLSPESESVTANSHHRPALGTTSPGSRLAAPRGCSVILTTLSSLFRKSWVLVQPHPCLSPVTLGKSPNLAKIQN